MAVAMGRVWSGRQALANGLIDDLGGLDRAIEVAKEEAGIPSEDEVILDHYPKKRGILSLIFSEDGPLGTVNWLAYHFFHEEVVGTVRTLMDADMLMDFGEVR